MTPHKRFFWGLIGGFIVAMNAGFVQDSLARSARPVGVEVRPIGMLALSHPAITIQRILDWRRLGVPIPPQIHGGAAAIAMTLSQMVSSLRGMTGTQLIERFPHVLSKLGLRLQYPMGLSFWQYGKLRLMVFSAQIEESRLRKWLPPLVQARFGRLVFSPKRGAIRRVSLQSPQGKTMPLCLITKRWLHILVPQNLDNDLLPVQTRMGVLRRIHAAYPNILRPTLRMFTSRNLPRWVKNQDADLIAGVSKQLLAQALETMTDGAFTKSVSSAMWRKMIPRISGVLSLKRGLSFRSNIHWGVRNLWGAKNPRHNWFRWIPNLRHLGWFGHSYFNHLAIHTEFMEAKRNGLIKPADYVQAIEGWNQALSETKKHGVDLRSLLLSWDGTHAGGILWHDDLVRSFLTNRQFPQHLMRSVFILFGFRHVAGTKVFLNSVQKLCESLIKEKALPAKRVRCKTARFSSRSGPLPAVKIQVIGLARQFSVYAVAYANKVLITGHHKTVEQFIEVWQNKRPQTLRGNARDRQGYFVLRPQVLHDVFAVLPPRWQTQFAPLLQRFHSFSIQAQNSPKTHSMSLNLRIAASPITSTSHLQRRLQQIETWKGTHVSDLWMYMLGAALGIELIHTFLSSPVNAGIIAAAIIPEALRFIRRSKTIETSIYMEAIAKGALKWFGKQHYDSAGNTIQNHFPHYGKGWICTPTQKPCVNKNALYQQNSARWKKEPWRSIQFGINQAHYFQYCYHSKGVGVNARFTLRAHADLDCDGTMSTYQINGTVDRSTGKVNISTNSPKHPLE